MLNSKMNLLPKRLNFVLTQVLSSKGIESTMQQSLAAPSSASDPKSEVKDIIERKQLTQAQRKSATAEIHSIFSKKKQKKKEIQEEKPKPQLTKESPVCKIVGNNQPLKKEVKMEEKRKEEIKPTKRKRVKDLQQLSMFTIGGWGKKKEEGETIETMMNKVKEKKQKDEYDLDYDRGKLKKIRTKIDPFKTPGNPFQAIENRGRESYLAKELQRRRIAKEMAKKRSQRKYQESKSS